MSARAIVRLLWLAAGFALVLTWQRDRILGWMPAPRELPRFDGATGRAWIEGGFVPGGAHQYLAPGDLPAHLHNASSWVGGDAWTGHAESAWFKANRRIIHVGVAGYPRHAGCAVWAEFRDAAGHVTRVDCPLPDPRETWKVWEIRTPSHAIAVRIAADDRAGDMGGWVAFSHPFRAWPRIVTAAYLQAEVCTTLALVLIMIWGPGVLLWSRRAEPPEGASAALVLIGTGPLLLALGGVALWCVSGSVSPQTAGLALVGAGWLALGRAVWRKDFAWKLGVTPTRVLGLSALIAGAVVAKSFHSVGPAGELFHGTISRNFEMTDRIDSRYSFYVVQVAAHHHGPASLAADKFFFPWTFFSRGPLAGLAATPLVLATDGHPPETMPEERWSPFDRAGFAAYRITMIVLASSVLAALCLVLAPLIGEAWAFTAAGLLALSPFGVHEILFTWPKWSATAWLVASFGLAHARRPFAAGLALAVGYLYHPLVLLWAPWLALWAAGRSARDARAIAGTLFRFGGAAGLVVLPWMALGALVPHAPETPVAGQGGFLVYWARADWQIATWSTWWHTRWMNFANTFVPLHLWLDPASFHHPKLGSAHEASGPLVKFAEVWWNSLPFALGLGLWVACLAALGRALRGWRAAAWLLVLAPGGLIVAYWGMDPLGLMRECGHPLCVALIALLCAVAAREDGGLRRIVSHPAVPWLQLPETWLMLWLTTLANANPRAVDYAELDATYLAINALALLAAAWVVSRARSAARFTTHGARLAVSLPAS